MKPSRLLALLAAAGLAAFALFGGEYGTFDWLQLRRQLLVEQQAVAELRTAVDSLERMARLFETSPAWQERVAREDFGMIRDGEMLYRLVPKH